MLQLHCFEEEISSFQSQIHCYWNDELFQSLHFPEHETNKIEQGEINLDTVHKDKNNMFSFSVLL